MKLLRIEQYSGTLRVLGSGLRIGGSKDIVGIGETDNPIIRHPITHLPYVPGSSVKGKVRSLLESRHCPRSQETGKPCDCGKCTVCRLFGSGDSKTLESPTRLTFRDSQPAAETLRLWEESGTTSEVKTEVLIDRNKGIAYGRIGPRTMERIPANSDFGFRFSIRIFEGDKVDEFYETVAEGFELLSKHYLGGSGSRGYGEVLIVGGEDGETPMHDVLRQKAKAPT